jgi:hypothetical protein
LDGYGNSSATEAIAIGELAGEASSFRETVTVILVGLDGLSPVGADGLLPGLDTPGGCVAAGLLAAG